MFGSRKYFLFYFRAFCCFVSGTKGEIEIPHCTNDAFGYRNNAMGLEGWPLLCMVFPGQFHLTIDHTWWQCLNEGTSNRWEGIDKNISYHFNHCNFDADKCIGLWWEHIQELIDPCCEGIQTKAYINSRQIFSGFCSGTDLHCKG